MLRHTLVQNSNLHFSLLRALGVSVVNLPERPACLHAGLLMKSLTWVQDKEHRIPQSGTTIQNGIAFPINSNRSMVSAILQARSRIISRSPDS
jgi:hypothetical protein